MSALISDYHRTVSSNFSFIRIGDSGLVTVRVNKTFLFPIQE